MKNNIIDVARSESSPTEPVSLTEAKAQAIITYSDDDTLLTSYITVARKQIENYCNISIVVQTVVLTADLYNDYELPYGPVTGIQAAETFTGTAGSGPAAYQTATTNWNTDGTQFLTFMPKGANSFNPDVPFRGYFQWGEYASPYAFDPGYRWRLTYTTGYGTVPDDLKRAILAQVVWLYEHRGDQSKDESNKFKAIPSTICTEAKMLSDPYKRQSWL